MSAESAIQTATLLQQKVGNSLSGVTNLLAPPERSDSMLNAGAASLPALVLDEVKELQKKTIESVDKVAQVLQSQLDLAQEAERRARDQAAELRKEKKNKIIKNFISNQVFQKIYKVNSYFAQLDQMRP